MMDSLARVSQSFFSHLFSFFFAPFFCVSGRINYVLGIYTAGTYRSYRNGLCLLIVIASGTRVSSPHRWHREFYRIGIDLVFITILSFALHTRCTRPVKKAI